MQFKRLSTMRLRQSLHKRLRTISSEDVGKNIDVNDISKKSINDNVIATDVNGATDVRDFTDVNATDNNINNSTDAVDNITDTTVKHSLFSLFHSSSKKQPPNTNPFKQRKRDRIRNYFKSFHTPRDGVAANCTINTTSSCYSSYPKSNRFNSGSRYGQPFKRFNDRIGTEYPSWNQNTIEIPNDEEYAKLMEELFTPLPDEVFDLPPKKDFKKLRYDEQGTLMRDYYERVCGIVAPEPGEFDLTGYLGIYDTAPQIEDPIDPIPPDIDESKPQNSPDTLDAIDDKENDIFHPRYEHSFTLPRPPDYLPKSQLGKWERKQMLRHTASKYDLKSLKTKSERDLRKQEKEPEMINTGETETASPTKSISMLSFLSSPPPIDAVQMVANVNNFIKGVGTYFTPTPSPAKSTPSPGTLGPQTPSPRSPQSPQSAFTLKGSGISTSPISKNDLFLPSSYLAFK